MNIDLIDVTLRKQLRNEASDKFWINDIFVTFAKGRTLGIAEDDTRVTIGIVLY